MSIYTVTPIVPEYQIDVGWDRQRQSYFVQVFDMQGVGEGDRAPVVMVAGDEDNLLPDIYALLDSTWTTVDWMAELTVLRRLRDDPLTELREHLLHSASTDVKKDSRRQIGTLIDNLFSSWRKPVSISSGRKRDRSA